MLSTPAKLRDQAIGLSPRKWLLRSNQTVLEVGTAFLDCAFVTHIPSGPEQAPNPTYFRKRNVETPYRSLRGQQAVRPAHGGAGTGSGKKRMPGCNGRDTGATSPDAKAGRLPHGLSSPESLQNHLYGRKANECSNMGACTFWRDVGRHQLGRSATPGKKAAVAYGEGGTGRPP